MLVIYVKNVALCMKVAAAAALELPLGTGLHTGRRATQLGCSFRFLLDWRVFAGGNPQEVLLCLTAVLHYYVPAVGCCAQLLGYRCRPLLISASSVGASFAGYALILVIVIVIIIKLPN
jgi:hypothetical protein